MRDGKWERWVRRELDGCLVCSQTTSDTRMYGRFSCVVSTFLSDVYLQAEIVPFLFLHGYGDYRSIITTDTIDVYDKMRSNGSITSSTLYDI